MFIKQLYHKSPILIHITVAVKISSFATTTIQKHFGTNIIKAIHNFVNMYETFKTQELIIASPGVLPLMPQHTDMVQENVISVSQKSTS